MSETAENPHAGRLFFVSSAMFDTNYPEIRAYLRQFPGSTIVSDRIDVTQAFERTFHGENPPYRFLLGTQYNAAVDRDEAYAECDSIYTGIVRAYVRKIRQNPRALDLELEKFRSVFIDKLYPLVTGMITSAKLVDNPLREATFIGESGHAKAFHDMEFKGNPRRSYVVPYGKEIAPYHILNLDGLFRKLVPGVFSRNLARAREFREDAQREITLRYASSRWSIRLFGWSFPPVKARALAVPQRPARPSFSYRSSNGGGAEFLKKQEATSFWRPISELKVGGAKKEITLLFAETQSRPYAEGLAILLANTPPEEKMVIVTPFASGAANETFNESLLALADAAGPQPALPVTKTRKKTGQGPTPRERLDARFPNIQFLYTNFPEDSAYLRSADVNAYYKVELDFLTVELERQLADRFPAALVKFARPAIRALLEDSMLRTFYCNEMARGILIELSGRVNSLVTYSGRVAEARVAAVEARRHGIPVVDWQCTILGKTPVFLSIIADRVLAICKNALEVYISYFRVKRENCRLIWFPRFVRTMRSYDPKAGQKALRAARIDPKKPFHIFAGQPLDRGYQKKIFDVLHEAAAKANATVLVCAHPTQRVTGETAFLEEIIASYPGGHLVYADDFVVHELFPLAKSTIAYSSTFLYEVASVGFVGIVLDPLDMPHVLDYTVSDEVLWAKTADQLLEKMREAEKTAPKLDDIDFEAKEREVCAAIWAGFKGTEPEGANP